MADDTTSQGDDDPQPSADGNTTDEAAAESGSIGSGEQSDEGEPDVGERGSADEESGSGSAGPDADLDERAARLEERETALEDREAELERREDRLDQREDGLDKRAADLEERVDRLDERADELEDREDQLETKREELRRREAEIAEREAELDEREATIGEREDELSRRATELDRKERTLQEYVGDQFAEVESDLKGTIHDAISSGMSQYSESGSRLGTVGNLLLGLVGIALVLGGVVNGLPILWGFEALLVGNETGLVVSVLLIFFGLAANLAAAASRV